MSSALPLTEAEQERAVRARIDRLREIREAYAARKGKHPQDVSLQSEQLAALDREEQETTMQTTGTTYAPEPGTKRAKLLEAAKRLVGPDGTVSRAAIMEAMGATDKNEQGVIDTTIAQLRKRGAWPYAAGRREKTAAKPRPELSALRRRINGDDAPKPASRPVVAVEPDEPETDGPERLAEIAADLCRTIDGLSDAERAFALAFVRHRY